MVSQRRAQHSGGLRGGVCGGLSGVCGGHHTRARDRAPMPSSTATRRSARKSHLQVDRASRPKHGTARARPQSRSRSPSRDGKRGRGNSKVIRVRSRSPVADRGGGGHTARSPSADGRRGRGRYIRCCGKGSVGRCWNRRRKKLSAMMLFSALFAFGLGLVVALATDNQLFATLCIANLVSSGCWHVNNLYMSGTPVGAAGKICCWIDRLVVAVTVGFGVWLAHTKGLQSSAIACALVPVLFASKSAISHRFLRTIVHCVMHQVGVLGGLASAALAVPASEFEELREEWWDGVLAFMYAVCVVQPVVGWLAYQNTKTLPNRGDWIWI